MSVSTFKMDAFLSTYVFVLRLIFSYLYFQLESREMAFVSLRYFAWLQIPWLQSYRHFVVRMKISLLFVFSIERKMCLIFVAYIQVKNRFCFPCIVILDLGLLCILIHWFSMTTLTVFQWCSLHWGNRGICLGKKKITA